MGSTRRRRTPERIDKARELAPRRPRGDDRRPGPRLAAKALLHDVEVAVGEDPRAQLVLIAFVWKQTMLRSGTSDSTPALRIIPGEISGEDPRFRPDRR